MTEPLQPPFAVVGLGLVGGSVARTLRSVFPREDILGIDPDAFTRESALRQNAVTKTIATPGDSPELSRCSVVFVCPPLHAIPDVFAQIAPLVGEAIVTDVAGVKRRVESWAAELLPGTRFVGGHPMAGGEKGGFDNSRSDMFDRVPVALCPFAETDPAPLVELWTRMGAAPVVMSAQQHDRLVAHTSHAPYIAALAHLRLLGEDPERRALIGRGFLDATRHAEFAPEVMASVASENAELVAVIRELAQTLSGLADELSHPKTLVETANQLRELRRKLER